MMHKEIVGRKKAPVIAIVFFVLTFMLYAQEGLKFIDFNNYRMLFVCKVAVSVLAIAIIIREFISCKISYKYALIANKLIVNKIFSREEKNLASIKISDIVYLGKKNGQSKKYDAKSIGNYTCDKLKVGQYCCVYKIKENYYKFYFQPSERFIKRIEKNIINIKDNKLNSLNNINSQA
ncbi:hypothetical protein ACFO6R_10305 [Eubacterium multiforme]|uniref:Uncharacterized protein n=1 Tax=Eubacterium multiforme TaxID=83339 RepID=A0ABT9UTW3_9FIRM|nr:hypothetical protein [Eubacterium multiforme]MDQ0149767.1 hypothetical protein [Eubacterium multiforme]